MVEQQTYTSADYPADLKCQTLSFLRMEWPEGFRGDNRLRDWVTQASDHPVHWVLVEAGILISHLNVVWKYLEHAGITFKTYGLTGVFTYPAFRRQGYGSRLVASGTASLQASDADIALFHCDPHLRDFYAQHGWEALDQAITFIGPVDAPVLVKDELLMMQFLSTKGQQGRTAFERQPIYFGSDSTW